MNGFGILLLSLFVGMAVFAWLHWHPTDSRAPGDGERRSFALPGAVTSFVAQRGLARAAPTDAGLQLAQAGCEAILGHVEVVCGNPIYPGLHLYLQAPPGVAAALESPNHVEILMDALARQLRDQAQLHYGSRAGGEVPFNYGGYVVELPVRIGPAVAAVASLHPLEDPFGGSRLDRPARARVERNSAAAGSGSERTEPIPTEPAAKRRRVSKHEVPATQVPVSTEHLELVLNVVGHPPHSVVTVGPVTVGRLPDCTMVLPEMVGLSREHLSVIPRGEGIVTVRDTSTCGVFHEGRRLGESTDLFLPASLSLDAEGICRLEVSARSIVPTS